jgi:tetratricopeptide (TPR) repeat protein
MARKRLWPLLVASLLLAGCAKKDELTPEQRHQQLMEQLDHAEVRLRNNKLGDAEEIFARVLQEIPGDARALLGMGKLRFQQEDLEAAEQFLDKAIAADPEVADGHFMKGQVLKHRDHFDEAAAAFAEAFRLAPERSEYGLQAGAALNEAEKYGDAENILRRVADLDPEAFDEHNTGVHTHLADALRGQDKLDEALKTYMKAQNIYNSDKMARAGAALVYEAKKDNKHAIDEWSAYIQRDCCSEYSNNVAKKKIMELEVERPDVLEEGDGEKG